MRVLPPVTLAALLLVTRPAAAQIADPPVPQDATLRDKLNRELLDWNQKTLGGAYEKVGKKSPKWDKAAREAFDAAARCFSRVVEPSVSEEDVYAAASRAVEAGCDDPLILALRARTTFNPKDPAEAGRRLVTAAVALEKSAYPPIRRAQALARAGGVPESKGVLPSPYGPYTASVDPKEAIRMLDAALALVPQTAAKDDLDVVTENARYDLLMTILLAFRDKGGDFQAAFDKVDAVLAKAPALKVQRLQVKAGFLIKYAWEARGMGMSGTVAQDGARKFEDRLAEALKALNQAWSLEPKPKGTRTPTLMLWVAKGLGPTRAEMESWFTRAMSADPNNAEACEIKMDFLDPKWHGSPQELLAFGKACRATKNWRAGITLVGVQAYQRVSFFVPPQQRQTYLPSKEVWDDVRSAYEEYLGHYPGDSDRRSAFAAYCVLCGQFAEADRQFKLVGDRLVGNRFVHLDQMEPMKRFVEAMPKAKPSGDRP